MVDLFCPGMYIHIVEIPRQRISNDRSEHTHQSCPVLEEQHQGIADSIGRDEERELVRLVAVILSRDPVLLPVGLERSFWILRGELQDACQMHRGGVEGDEPYAEHLEDCYVENEIFLVECYGRSEIN